MEYGTGKQLAENYRANDVWTWLFFNPESWGCEIYGFDTTNKKVIVYNGVNFNYEEIRTMSIEEFAKQFENTIFFCCGMYNVCWRNIGYAWKGHSLVDYRAQIEKIKTEEL